MKRDVTKHLCSVALLQFTYDAKVGSLTIPVQVMWNQNKTLDNPTNISGTLSYIVFIHIGHDAFVSID